jgi:hypothetical protein
MEMNMQAELSRTDIDTAPASQQDSILVSRPIPATELPIQLNSEEFKTVASPTASPAEMKAILIAALERVLEDEAKAEAALLEKHETQLNQETDLLMQEPEISLDRIKARGLDLGIPESIITDEINAFTSRKGLASTISQKLAREAHAMGLPEGSSLKNIEREREIASEVEPVEVLVKAAIQKLLNDNTTLSEVVTSGGFIKSSSEEFPLRLKELYLEVPERCQTIKTLKPVGWFAKLLGKQPSEYETTEKWPSEYEIQQPTKSPSFNRLLEACQQYGIKVEVHWQSGKEFIYFRAPLKTETPN